MKIAIVGDSHADSQGDLGDHNNVMQFVVRDAEEQGCTALIHTGDVFERRSTSEERASVAAWVQMAAERMDVIIVRGNHDDPLDIELLGQLQHPDVFTLLAFTQPGTVQLDGCVVRVMPWPQRGGLLAQSSSRGEAEETAHTALRNILHEWGNQRGDETNGELPHIFAGHCSLRGSRLGENQPPLVGADFELGSDDLDLARCDFYALGHIHLGQVHESPAMGRGEGRRIVYPGSPRRCNYGEPDDKRYLIYDTKTGELTPRETPARAMALVEASFDAELGALSCYPREDGSSPRHDIPKGAKVRIRYETTPEHRELAQQAAAELKKRLLDEGAHEVKLEAEIEVETRARAPQVATQPTTAGKLAAYWEANTEPPSDADRVQLMQRLELLEQEQ